MEKTARFRHYLNSITEAFLQNNISELHRMEFDATSDYAKDSITYRQLYVINAIVATFTIASMYEE